MTKEEISEISKKVHKNQYIFSAITKEYKKAEQLPIICEKHGIFYPRLYRFLQGSNCPHCIGKVKKTLSDFIDEANIVHNNKYDYSEFKYINSHTKSTIICPKHGSFEQMPTNHLNGNGCPHCKSETLQKKNSLSVDEFINKAKAIHNDKYDYSKVNYVNNITLVDIICPLHGNFQQMPINHLQGRGCPICKLSHMETEMRNLLTENKIEFEEQKHFEWLGKLSLDFFLPKHNLAIECQGIQHFKALPFFGGEKEFLKIQYRDNKKKQLCIEHHIQILYYSNIEMDFPYEVYTQQEELLTIINDAKT